MKRVVAVFALLLTLVCAPALAVDYAIEGYDMTVRVRPDGSADVTEVLRYDFEDDYNGILSSFDVGDVEGLEYLRLYVDKGTVLRRVDRMDKEPFTYTAQRDGRLLNVQAYAPGSGGERVFRYEYRLTGLCQRYQDAARLNYKLIGTANQVPLENAMIRIEMPGEILDAWAHGAMGEADVHRDGNALTYGPSTVRPGQFAEADVLFDEASLAEAPVIDQMIIHQAQAEEAELVERARQALFVRARWRNVLSMLALLPAAALAWLWFWLGRAVGYRRKVEPAVDLSALTGVRAAVAQWVHEGHVNTQGLTGTLLELVQVDAVALIPPENEDETISFVRKREDVPGLTDHQRHVLHWLFKGAEPLTVSSMDAGADEKKAKKYLDEYGSYQRLVRKEAEASSYASARNGKLWLPVVLCVMCAALSAGLFALGGLLLGGVMLALIAVVIVMCCQLRRLSGEGERVEAALLTLMTQDKGTPSKALMPYLPIIAALGGLESYFGEPEAASDWDGGMGYPYWMYAGFGRDMGRTRRRFNETHESNRNTVARSGDSGGGSSGGGGGGGGHGAW